MRTWLRSVRRRRVGWAAVGLCAAAGAVWLAAAGGALRGQPPTVGPAGKPVTIAVVNIKQVSDTCQRTQDLRSALEQQREAKLDALRDLREKLQRAREDLKVLVTGTAAWRKQNAEALRMEVEARVLSELSVKELQAQNLDYTAQIYESVLKETERYAEAHRIDVVLRTGEALGEAKTLEELYRQMALRTVLYAAPTLDITEAILREVNRAYEAEKGGSGRREPGGP